MSSGAATASCGAAGASGAAVLAADPFFPARAWSASPRELLDPNRLPRPLSAGRAVCLEARRWEGTTRAEAAADVTADIVTRAVERTACVILGDGGAGAL